MEYMPNFKLHRPARVADAVSLRAQDGALYVAGGTDMVVNVRRGIEQPKHLIDLSALPDLRQRRDDAGTLVLGSGVTLHEIGHDATIQARFPAVAEAARAVAGPTHQAYGTLGGNLCLDTRCLFYNQSEWWRKSNDYCLKERGDTCHVAPGGSQCFAAFSGDVSPALIVYGAEVEIAGHAGTRRIPLARMYTNDGMAHLALQPGELVTAVHLPPTHAGDPSAYEKARVRGSIDFPLAGVAVRVKMAADGTLADLAIALTAVNPSPQRVKDTDKFIGKTLGEAELDALRELVRKQAKPMRTTTVAPWYRRRVVGALARRLTARLAGLESHG
jgi:4-hydroxybenzoyl-CoA reductase subunit beta